MNKTLFPVVILAGGLATRLRPITETIPKALILVKGIPFIDHQLQLLYQQGIREVIICVGYLGEMVQEYVGNGSRYQMAIHYSYDGEKLLGTAGAIKKALPLLSDNFFVLYGDSYLPCHYYRVQEVYEKSQKQSLMTVFHNEGQWDASNVEFIAGKITAYNKKNRTERMAYIDYGLGIFSRQIFTDIPLQISYDLADLYSNLLKNDQLVGHEVQQRFYEVGSFKGIQELESYLTEKKEFYEFY